MSNVPLSGSSEVADYFSWTQIEVENGILETQMLCGPASVVTNKYAGYPKHGPMVNYETYDSDADSLYVKYVGPNVASDVNGVTIDVLHTMIVTSGLHYQDIQAITPNSVQSSDMAHIRAALAQGYPVIATVLESSVWDMASDVNGNPYYWVTPTDTATHVITFTGIAQDGVNLLSRDTINITGDVAGANTVRPGPRTYDASKIAVYFATAIKLSWLPSIPVGFDFTQGVINPMSVMNTPGTAIQQAQAQAIWNVSPLAPTLSFTSGIATVWKQLLYTGRNFGPPSSVELSHDPVTGAVLTDWSGNPIIMQWYGGCNRIEWKDNVARAFTPTQEINLYS